MVQRGRYAKGGGKVSNIPRDNRRVQTLRILKSAGRMNQNQLMHKQGLTKSHWRNFQNILGEMEGWGWLNKDPSTEAKNVKIFSLTNLGHSVHDSVNELLKNDKMRGELMKFEMFYERKETNQNETDQASSD